MDIGYFIGDLLKEQDEVNVPELGTFFKLHVPASFDPVSNTFQPPSYQLGFRKGTGDLQALTEYISRQKKLSASSSEYFVQKFTSNIFDLLRDTGVAEIKPLGVLHKENDELTFENADPYDFSDQYFGLKAVERMHREEKEHTESLPIVAAGELYEIEKPSGTTVSSINEDSGSEIPGSVNEEKIFEISETEDSEVEYTSPAKFSPLLATSLIMAILVLGGFLLYRFNPAVQQWVDNYRYSSSSGVPETAAPELKAAPLTDSLGTRDSVISSSDTSLNNLNTPADSTRSAMDTLNNDPDMLQLNRDRTSQPSTEQVQAAASEEAITFEIIGAAFGSKKEAETHIKQLAARGIQAKIVDNIPGRMIKISLGSFKDEASARVELTRIHKDLNRDAWIARVKPTQNP